MITSKTNPINITLDKNYDSEFCGSIPLHLVNLIQPHGMLLVLDKQELHIVQASANTEYYLGIEADDLIDKPLAAFLPNQEFTEIKTKISNYSSPDNIPFNIHFTTTNKTLALTALVHPKEDYILVELEKSPAPDQESSFSGLYQRIKHITSRLKGTPTIADASQLFAEEVKKITSFDRVLVYQFDSQWNGIVIAQCKEPDMDDYMDLRFPASDVPKQARDLYFRNPYRLIPTRDYTPVGLIPVINPISKRFTDLSDCNLRSVATVHLEYLTNLQVMASMSLPIIIDDKLWGLISCHHKQPKYLNYEVRSALELLSGIFSGHLAAKEKEASMGLRVQLRSIHASLLERLYNSQTISEGLLSGETTLLQLLNCSGAAIIHDYTINTAGLTPNHAEIKALTLWLKRNNPETFFATDTLPSQYVSSQDYKDIASGLIALAINPDQGDYILCFRPEALQTIKWGGNPNQAIQMEADGKTYHPRNSFATYKETIKHTSAPWLPEELDAAAFLRNAVLEKIIRENY